MADKVCLAPGVDFRFLFLETFANLDRFCADLRINQGGLLNLLPYFGGFQIHGEPTVLVEELRGLRRKKEFDHLEKGGFACFAAREIPAAAAPFLVFLAEHGHGCRSPVIAF